jgi:predicted anti-sigma-YlaC factor YlaD
MKECRDFCNYISDYLDGEMCGEDCRLLEEHLEVCPPCQLMYESLRTTVELCQRGVSAEIPDDVRSRLRAFLQAHCNIEKT